MSLPTLRVEAFEDRVVPAGLGRGPGFGGEYRGDPIPGAPVEYEPVDVRPARDAGPFQAPPPSAGRGGGWDFAGPHAGRGRGPSDAHTELAGDAGANFAPPVHADRATDPGRAVESGAVTERGAVADAGARSQPTPPRAERAASGDADVVRTGRDTSTPTASAGGVVPPTVTPRELATPTPALGVAGVAVGRTDGPAGSGSVPSAAPGLLPLPAYSNDNSAPAEVGGPDVSGVVPPAALPGVLALPSAADVADAVAAAFPVGGPLVGSLPVDLAAVDAAAGGLFAALAGGAESGDWGDPEQWAWLAAAVLAGGGAVYVGRTRQAADPELVAQGAGRARAA